MREMIDLTEAWLEWKETCAAKDCSAEHRSNLENVAERVIASKLRTLNPDQVSYWKEYSSVKTAVSVFHELEALLYQKDKIKGIPFKEYLFDFVGKRPGGVGKNLTGYLINQMLVHEFYDKVVKDLMPEANDASGNPNAPENRDVDVEDLADNDNYAMPGSDESMFISEEIKKAVLEIMDSQWDDDIRLGFFCNAYNIPLTNPDVEPFFRRRKSALAVALHKAQAKMIEDLSAINITNRTDFLIILKTIVVPHLGEFVSSQKEIFDTLYVYVDSE